MTRVRLDDLAPGVRARALAVIARQDEERAARRGEAVPTAPSIPPPPQPKPARGPRGPRAVRTRCADGHVHASRLEARVCDRLSAECRASGAMLYQQIGYALTNLAPTDSGRPLRFTVDFVLVLRGETRYVEAKGRWRSRDYVVRRCAFEGLIGRSVEEVSE